VTQYGLSREKQEEKFFQLVKFYVPTISSIVSAADIRKKLL